VRGREGSPSGEAAGAGDREGGEAAALEEVGIFLVFLDVE